MGTVRYELRSLGRVWGVQHEKSHEAGDTAQDRVQIPMLESQLGTEDVSKGTENQKQESQPSSSALRISSCRKIVKVPL